MTLIKDNTDLQMEIARISEVAGYLWEKGWAERNGGNISVNVTSLMDKKIKELPAWHDSFMLPEALNGLKNNVFYVTGTGKRMRDVARDPLRNGSLVRITSEGNSYEIIAQQPVIPTSSFPAHLLIHNFLCAEGRNSKVVLHSHPTELIALTHQKTFLNANILTRKLWSMIPECRIIVPKGIGVVPYELPGTIRLARETIKQLETYDMVLWEKHGALTVGDDIIDCFDVVDTLSKAAQIYLASHVAGFEPDGLTDQQVDDLVTAFNLPGQG